MSRDSGLRMVLRRSRYTRKGVLKEPLVFQIAPLDEFGWDTTYLWNDYDTISAGQFTSRGGRQLRTLTINTVSMDWSAPWAVVQTGRKELARTNADYYGRAAGPWKLAARLDDLVLQGSPLLLIVNNPALYDANDLRMIVTMRSANVRERAGEPDARYFEMGFTEYRAPVITRKNYGKARHPLPAQVVLTKNGVAVEVERRGKALPKNQRHKIGSSGSPATLRKLAKHYYGTPKEWKRIAKRNSIAKNISGDDSLKKLYDRRKRKGKPVRLNIPARSTARFDSASGGLTI